MSFPRYPKYKDSGVEWLGEVPEHWKIVRGRRLFSQKREAALANDEQLSATQKYGVVPQKVFMELEDQKVALALSGTDNFKHVEQDDFVISLRSFQGGIERSLYPGCVSPAYTVLRPTQTIHPGFWAYLLKSAGYIESLQTMTDGIRDGKTISYQQFGQIGLPLPSLEEQVALASLLDRETAKIDSLIAEQQRLIELLQEKRQAVISHAVTKGLNPDAPMKDSGIEWLAEVPEHWRVMTVRRLLCRVEQGWSPECFAHPAEIDEWGVVKAGCVNRGVFNEADNKALPGSLAPLPQYQIQVGDLLMSRASGSPDLVGSTAYVEQVRPRLMLSDKIFRLHTTPIVTRRYFALLFNARIMRLQIERAISGADGLANNLPQSALRSFFCVIPPVEEQHAVVSDVTSRLVELRQLSDEAVRTVSLLQERRSALISAAVTGQIDVRGLAGGSEAA